MFLWMSNHIQTQPANYMFKVNNRNTRKQKLTTETLEQGEKYVQI